MADHALRGIFPGRRMSQETLKDWTKTNFAPLIGYYPQVVIFVHGWIVCTLQSVGEV